MSTAPPRTPESGVTVLAFLDASDDSTIAYVSEAMADDIVTRLRSLKLFDVNGQSSLRQFAPLSSSELATFGQQHGARYLLTGAVRRTGLGLGVSVRLSETQMGIAIWSADFDRPEGTLLGLVKQIVQEVATRVSTGNTGSGQIAKLVSRGTNDGRAYIHFLRANFFAGRESARAMSVAIAEYERATQIDPEYGEAFAQLAMAYATVLQRGWRLGNLAADALYASGWAAAERARLTTPDVPVVWLARASLLELRYPRSFQGALSSYQHAAVLQPSSSEVYRRYGTALLQLGDETGAETQLRHAEELDPQDALTNFELARLHVHKRRLGEACRLLNTVIELDPRAAYAYALRGLVRLRQGEVRDAWSDAETASLLGNTLWGEAIAALADAHALDTASARARTRRLLRETTTSVRQLTWWNAGYLAMALASIGDSDNAFDMLDHLAPRGAILWTGLQDPGFDRLRKTDRFKALLEEAKPAREVR